MVAEEGEAVDDSIGGDLDAAGWPWPPSGSISTGCRTAVRSPEGSRRTHQSAAAAATLVAAPGCLLICSVEQLAYGGTALTSLKMAAQLDELIWQYEDFICPPRAEGADGSNQARPIVSRLESAIDRLAPPNSSYVKQLDLHRGERRTGPAWAFGRHPPPADAPRLGPRGVRTAARPPTHWRARLTTRRNVSVRHRTGQDGNRPHEPSSASQLTQPVRPFSCHGPTGTITKSAEAYGYSA